MKKILCFSCQLILFVSCEQEGTHYRCSAGNPGIFPTPSGCIESENGEFDTMADCEMSCDH